MMAKLHKLFFLPLYCWITVLCLSLSLEVQFWCKEFIHSALKHYSTDAVTSCMQKINHDLVNIHNILSMQISAVLIKPYKIMSLIHIHISV